jgi:hypothetical protein
MSEAVSWNVIILTDTTRVEGKSWRIHLVSYIFDAPSQTANLHVR